MSETVGYCFRHGNPVPGGARDTLDQLSADERAVRYPPLPRWFFLAQAALLGGIFLAQLLPPDDTPEAMLAVTISAVVLGGRYWIFRDQVQGVTPNLRDMAWFLAGILGAMLTCFVVSETTEVWWIWIAGAVVGAVIVLGTGGRYVRTYGRA